MLTLDKAIHDFFSRLNDIKWLEFPLIGRKEEYRDYYYAENELYIIRDKITGEMFFVKAGSPLEALTRLEDLEAGL